MAAEIKTSDLLDAGVYFGHQTANWNPKMKQYILASKNGNHIIDVDQTIDKINESYNALSDIVSKGGQVLFVGTKAQARKAIAEQATRVGMPFVNQRWLGGMLTNFNTISARLDRLKELEDIGLNEHANKNHTKKELLLINREKEKLSRILGGLRNMSKAPKAVWIVDTNKEHLAVNEARKLNIPVFAIADTNVNPDLIDYIIPGNDDAIASVDLLTKVIADAVANGISRQGEVKEAEAATAANATAAVTSTGEPLADWEKELLADSQPAAATTNEGDK